jgi:hypothetical protein
MGDSAKKCRLLAPQFRVLQSNSAEENLKFIVRTEGKVCIAFSQKKIGDVHARMRNRGRVLLELKTLGRREIFSGLAELFE